MQNITTPMIIEQHIHGAFGIDYNTAKVEEIIKLSDELFKHGIGGVFPTLVTDSIPNIKRQIINIKKASELLSTQSAKILGIHLEGIFINPLKKGIHDEKFFLDLTIENYKKIEDDFIKIVTLAPELDKGLLSYLQNKNIKIQAGHCIGAELSNVSGVTHCFNAMQGVSHKERTTLTSALINDNLYTEIIADGIHVNNDALNLLLKIKPENKIILVSDALPITYSNLKETVFANSHIYYDGIKATSKEGTLAGSTTLIDKMIKFLGQKGLFKTQFITNVYEYHNLKPINEIVWDNDWNIKEICLIS